MLASRLLYRVTKTDASDITLPMPEIVATALVIRRDEQDKSRADAGEAWQAAAAGPDLVITGRYGTAVRPRTLNRRFAARCDAAWVRPLTVHDARRTCATLLVAPVRFAYREEWRGTATADLG